MIMDRPLVAPQALGSPYTGNGLCKDSTKAHSMGANTTVHR
jgi:hypothetical protein